MHNVGTDFPQSSYFPGESKCYDVRMKSVDPQCVAFQRAIDLLARPWTALILAVLQKGPRRFSELEAGCHGVGAKVLSARLKELETRGIVVRHVDTAPPIRVEYALTARGRAFGEVASAIERWGRHLAG